MKRGAIIVLLGLILSVAGGFAAYFARTAPQRAIMCSAEPEMAWLKQEYHLTDEQFSQVEKMHAEYLQQCGELCMRIAATNELVRAKISMNGGVAPELQQLLENAAALRAECQKNMLGHCFAVSSQMLPDDGKRYLAWVQEQVLAMPHERPNQSSPHAMHGH
jgi:hypothetical protein